MISKDEYRNYFLKWKRYVRYAPIMEDLGLQKANFSQFLSGSNINAMSVEKLEQIKMYMEALFVGKMSEDAK